MSEERKVKRTALETPWAAAVAGIVFSVLMLVILGLYWAAVPPDPLQPGAWISDGTGMLSVAVYLVPFAGIAFLWFIGVLRDRLGEQEDHFFATVFFGSGLLFLSMLFVAAATVEAVMHVFAAEPDQARNLATFNFARTFAYNIVNVYAIKAAGVFMITTSTIALYTVIVPRWIALLGLALALFLLFGSYYVRWSFAVVPLWILLISVHVLIDNFHQRNQPARDKGARAPDRA